MKGRNKLTDEQKDTRQKRARRKNRQEQENVFEFSGEEAAEAKKVAAEHLPLGRKAKRSIFHVGVSSNASSESLPAPKRPRQTARVSVASILPLTNQVTRAKPPASGLVPLTLKAKARPKIAGFTVPTDNTLTARQPSSGNFRSSLKNPLLSPSVPSTSHPRHLDSFGDAHHDVKSNEAHVSNSSTFNECLSISTLPMVPPKASKRLSQNPSNDKASHEKNNFENKKEMDREDGKALSPSSLPNNRSQSQGIDNSLLLIAKETSANEFSATHLHQTASKNSNSQTDNNTSPEHFRESSKSVMNGEEAVKRISSNSITLGVENETSGRHTKAVALESDAARRANNENPGNLSKVSSSIPSEQLDLSIDGTCEKQCAPGSLSSAFVKKKLVPRNSISKIKASALPPKSQNAPTVPSKADLSVPSIALEDNLVFNEKGGQTLVQEKTPYLSEQDSTQAELTKASQLAKLLESLKSGDEVAEVRASDDVAKAHENDPASGHSPSRFEQPPLSSAPAVDANARETSPALPLTEMTSASCLKSEHKSSPGDSPVLPQKGMEQLNSLGDRSSLKTSNDESVVTRPAPSAKSSIEKEHASGCIVSPTEGSQVSSKNSSSISKTPPVMVIADASEASVEKRVEILKSNLLVTSTSEPDNKLTQSSPNTSGDAHKKLKSSSTEQEFSSKCENGFVQSNDHKRKILQSSTFSKRVRFSEPSQPLRTSGRNMRLLQLIRRRRQRSLRKVSYGSQDLSVASATKFGSDQRHLQLHVDELQYLLDGVFKHDITSSGGIKLIMTSLHALIKLFLRKNGRRISRDIPFTDAFLGEPIDPSTDSEKQGDIVDLLVTQPKLFSKIVNQLCTLFGKSRSVDALIALLLVIIFRSAGTTLLVSQVEVDLLLNVYLSTCAACFRKDNDAGSRREVTGQLDKRSNGPEKRGIFAMRDDKFTGRRQSIDVLNELIAAAGLIEEDMTNPGEHVFTREVHAAAYLLGTGLAVLLSAIPDIRMLMRSNRRLDLVVTIVYTAEEFAKRRDSHDSSKPASHSMGWRVTIGSAMRVLQFAAYDEVCQIRIATESRVVAIAVDVLRKVKSIRIGYGLDGEWVVCNALKLCINLMRGSDTGSSSQFVKVDGLNVVLDCLTSECIASELLERSRGTTISENSEDSHDGRQATPVCNEISFDIRVLCLALLANAVHGDAKACKAFPFLEPTFLKDDDVGALNIALEILARSSDEGNNHTETNMPLTGKERVYDKMTCGSNEKENPISSMERKVTIGYVCLLLGALVRQSPENRTLLTERLSVTGLLGIAEVLQEFLEFHHEVGVVSASVDQMYQSIITALRENPDIITAVQNVKGLTSEQLTDLQLGSET